MSTDREVQETVARCLACIVFYHNSRSVGPAVTMTAYRNVMVSEVQQIARTVATWGLDCQTEALIFDPVRDGLVARYGPELGDQLYADFSRAFNSPA